MSIALGKSERRIVKSIAPDAYERFLAVGAVVLLVAMLVAIGRGYAQWSRIPWAVWPHLATIALALALTPVLLLRPRGDKAHRLLGTVWLLAMIGTALVSFNIRMTNPGGFSFIHLLSVWTLIQVPVIWYGARTHRIDLHRRSVRGMVTGALLIAGFFTFPFDRLLGHWLFS